MDDTAATIAKAIASDTATTIAKAIASKAANPDGQAHVRSTVEADANTWHRRFGHLSSDTLKGIEKVTTGLLGPIPRQSGDCSICSQTKAIRVINRQTPERATRPLERIHTDMWGPIAIPTKQGAQYIITFTDDYSRKSWVYFVEKRSELRTVFLQFKAERELEHQQGGYKIQKVRCDNGPEYRALGREMHAEYGIIFEYTTTYTP